MLPGTWAYVSAGAFGRTLLVSSRQGLAYRRRACCFCVACSAVLYCIQGTVFTRSQVRYLGSFPEFRQRCFSGLNFECRGGTLFRGRALPYVSMGFALPFRRRRLYIKMLDASPDVNVSFLCVGCVGSRKRMRAGFPSRTRPFGVWLRGWALLLLPQRTSQTWPRYVTNLIKVRTSQTWPSYGHHRKGITVPVHLASLLCGSCIGAGRWGRTVFSCLYLSVQESQSP